MNINAKISIYNRMEEGKPNIPINAITVEEFCGAVMVDEYTANLVKAVREEQDEEKRKKLKKALPFVTPSGVFSQAKNDCLQKHSGFICIDLDAKYNPGVTNWAGLRDVIGGWKQVLFSALSASGNGVFCLVPISNSSHHLAHFDSLSLDFKRKGLTVDPVCRNVARLRFFSHDPEAVWNPTAKNYTRIYKPPKPTPEKYTATSTDDLGKLIELINKSNTDITADYVHWYEVGAALANEMGEAGRSAYHTISQHYPKYNASKTDRQFNQCLKNPKRYTKATIFHLAKLAGLTLK